MTPREREKLIFEYIASGDWDRAIEHARAMPHSEGIWQRLPSAHEEGMPNAAINKVLDYLDEDELKDSGFLFEVAHNLMGHHNEETVRRLADAAHKYGGLLETQKIISHPSYKLTPEEQGLASVHNFWKSYEAKVSPEHFATIKSLYSGVPETISHRGLEGKSDDYYVMNGRHVQKLSSNPTVQAFSEPNKAHNGDTYTKAHHILPYLRAYASKIQEQIVKDKNIRKRYYGGEPYIKAYRGIGGHYSKMIRDAAGYNARTNEHDHKYLTIPVAPFSSWTTDLETAKSFAKGRGADLDLPGHGLVISKWMPVKDILHSGCHDVLPGRSGTRPSEQEIIFGHPTGKIKINTEELYFENVTESQPAPVDTSFEEPKNYYESVFSKGKKREKFSKSLKDRAIQLSVAAAMLGIPQQLSEQPKTLETPQAQPKSQAQDYVKPLPGLKYIEMIESSGGKKFDHRLVTTGLNAGTRAIGRYGIMPLQAIETVSKDKVLSQQYPEFLSYDHVKDADKITQAILGDRNLENKIANAHWSRLYHKFDGDENKMAYAWLHGITGALRTPYEEIKNHNYVKKYNKYKKLLNIERIPAELQKSEQALPSSVRQLQGFEAAGELDDQAQLAVKQINEFIGNKEFHPVPSAGHFSAESFVLGTHHDNSWLLKVESGIRPDIASARAGLQSVKEYAFYVVAREVFGLGDVLPYVILGELQYTNETKPAVAIKMLDDRYKLAVDYERAAPGSMDKVLEPYRESGVVHKIAAVLYVLGDGDSHGKNVMTDGHHIKIIDHGSGFANDTFNPAEDKNIFIPYVLRVGRIKDDMTADQKLELLPTVQDRAVKDALASWILLIDFNRLAQKLNILGIDPAPVLNRLKKLQNRVSLGVAADQAINEMWVL